MNDFLITGFYLFIFFAVLKPHLITFNENSSHKHDIFVSEFMDNLML